MRIIAACDFEWRDKMKKLNSAVALAALAALMTTPAFAADVEPMPVAEDWTGFHVGAGGGANFLFVKEEASASYDNTFGNTFADAESSSDLGDDGFFGTVEAGFDWQINSIVIGALANYDFGKTKVNSETETDVCTTFNCNAPGNADFSTSVKVGDSWAVGARLGLLATERTLVYVLGGYTEAKVSQEIEFSSDDVSFNFSDSNSKWESGYFIGGGIETLLWTDSISLKGEYRFSDYGKVKSSSDENPSSNVFTGTDQSSDVTVHSVRAVLSFRF